MSDGERYIRMCEAARAELPAGKFGTEQTQILALALSVARENDDAPEWILRRKIKDRIRKKMRGQYGFISWQIVLWWILPKLIDWFVVWWLRDKERQQSQ